MDKKKLYGVRLAVIAELLDTEVYGLQELTRKVSKLTNMTQAHIKRRVKITDLFSLAYYLGFRKVPYRFHDTEQVFDVEKWCRKLHVAMRSKPKKYKVVIKRRKTHE